MKKLGLYTLILCSLIACGKVDEEKDKKKDTDPFSVKAEEKDTTSREGVCTVGEPVGSSIYKGTWKVTRNSPKNVQIQEVMLFEPNAVQMTMICTYNSQSVTSTARVNAAITPKTHEILMTSTDTQTKDLSVGGESYKCTAHLESTSPDTLKYEFQGACLYIKGLYDNSLPYVPNY
jgi:hypothetical protein